MSEVVEAGHDTHDDHHDHGPDKGLARWLFTTNHKDIGTLYLWFSFLMFLIGGVLALVIRAELFQPGLQFVAPEFFNQMTTNHGLIMVFGAIMPAFVGLANWLVPMMVGAPDMALPRMNNLSFWILPFAFSMLIATLFMDGRRAELRLDVLRAAVDDLRAGDGHLLHLRRAPDGRVVDHGLDQHHRHHSEHARTGHDAHEDAAVRLDLADHRLPAAGRHAGAGGCGHHDAVRHSLRHQLLQRRRRR